MYFQAITLALALSFEPSASVQKQWNMIYHYPINIEAKRERFGQKKSPPKTAQNPGEREFEFPFPARRVYG